MFSLFIVEPASDIRRSVIVTFQLYNMIQWEQLVLTANKTYSIKVKRPDFIDLIFKITK